MSVTFNPINKIWKGSQNKSLFNPNAGLGEILLGILARTPNKVTQICAETGKTMKCRELRGKSIRAAENLIQKGYKFGDIFAVVSRNNQDVAPVIFASAIIGAPVNCLDPTFTVKELRDLLSLTKPKLVFCEAINVVKVQEALNDINLKAEIIILGETGEKYLHVTALFKEIDGLSEDHYVPPVIKNPESHTAFILCSSGTTGPSKGVCLSHSHIISQCSDNWGANQDESLLCFSSLYWISGMMSLLYGTISGMTRIITTDTFSAKLTCDLIEKYQITSAILPPSHVSQVLQYENVDKVDFSSVRYILSGGSFVSDNLRQRMQKYLKPGYGNIVIGYGLTEVGGLGTITYPVNKLGSVGTPMQRVQVKIVEEETGKNLGYKEPGEICFKYDYLFLGYYGNSEQTKAAFDADGWLRSGDIGYFDEENHLYILDRKKDIIKYKNYQISPSDIESELQKATGILSICIVGIEDIENGTDLPAALIEKNMSQGLSEEDIIKIATKVLPDYKHLYGGCYFVDSLPMTPSGKVQRRLAKELANKFYRSNHPLKSL